MDEQSPPGIGKQQQYWLLTYRVFRFGTRVVLEIWMTRKKWMNYVNSYARHLGCLLSHGVQCLVKIWLCIFLRCVKNVSGVPKNIYGLCSNV